MTTMDHQLHTADVVPGTVHLVDVDGQRTHGRHTGENSDIVLVPQASKDPEDPLNWTRKRKMWALAMVYVYTMGIGLPVTLHYSVMADITKDTGISTADLVNGNGIMFLCFGWACLFWQAIASAYGRRGVYLISMLLLIPLMIWTAHASSAGTWYAQRTIIGFACSPIESLPEISIADLFFAHERGTYMATYVLLLFESNFIAPLIAGWMDDGLGWRGTMNAGAIIAAITFVIMFFGTEETMYFRQTFEGIEVPSPSQSVQELDEGAAEKSKNNTEITTAKVSDDDLNGAGNTPPAASSPSSYWDKLKPFRKLPGRPNGKQVLTMMWRPLVIIVRFPNIAFAGFIYGINLSWYNVLNGTISPVLSASPYNWRSALVGCVYVGPIIGAALACVWSGWVADWLALYLARRNHGVREPEHRLYPLAVAGVSSTMGLIIWGVGAAHHVHWIGLVFGLALLTFGIVVGGSIGLSYAVDCFKEISGESMASVIIIRNTLGFAFSYAITPWYTNMGLQNCFITAGFVSLASMATFLLMTWKGKSFRRNSAKTYWQYVESNIGTH